MYLSRIVLVLLFAMAFIYARAVNAFMGTNVLILPADSMDAFHFIGFSTMNGKNALHDARAAARSSSVVGVIRAATMACGYAHAAATSAVRSTRGVRGGSVLDADHLRAGAANFYLASLALDTAYSAQQVAMDANRGDTNVGAGTDASAYSPPVQRVVDAMATQAREARELCQTTMEAASVGDLPGATAHALDCRHHARTAVEAVHRTAAHLLHDGPGDCSIADHRALCQMFKFTALCLAAASSALVIVDDMDSNVADPNNDTVR